MHHLGLRRVRGRHGLGPIALEHHGLRLLIILAREQHALGHHVALLGRTVEEYGDDEYDEDDQYHGADNAFFQGSFHHDSGREYIPSACNTGPTI